MSKTKYIFIISIVALISFTVVSVISPPPSPTIHIVNYSTPTLVSSTPTLTNQPVTQNSPTQIPPKPTPTPDSRCIITVDSQKYDVSSFLNQHSGGDIFQCGTDMTSVFNRRHDPSYLQAMTQYKI
jgi:hypothetical protein